MKLNKIASAVGVACLALSSAAWSDTVNAPDAALGVTGTYSVSGVPLVPNAPATGSTLTVTGSSTLLNPNGTLLNPNGTGLNPTVSTTRVDTPSTSAGAVGNQTTNTLTTPTVNLGAQGNGTSIQGTLGGAGGVSGLATTDSKSTTYVAGNTIKANTVYSAGSIIGGVTMAADGVLASATTALAGDKILATSQYGTGIKGTDHDFTKGATYNGGNTVGLCTYCHTPHKGASTLLLWNHSLSAQTFQWDVAATTAGTALPGFAGGSYKGPSAKCLSCHDGSVAIGDIGWFNQTARNGVGNPAAISTVKMTSAAKLVGNTSGDMTGTHPVAIPYPLNGAPNVYNGSTTGARLATNDFVTDPTANNIRLYSDVGGGQIVGKVTPGKTGIECSSCHDPHNKAATDRFLLRGKLVGSTQADGYICVQCHTK